MPALTLAQASVIVDAALQKGRELGLAPLTVAVLDAGGQLKALKRDDGASLLRPEIAMGKAWGCLGMGFGGREIVRRWQKAPAFMTALTELSGGSMVGSPGGVLIRDAANAILGAVGISGDAGEQDEVCSVAGIVAAGLKPDTGDPA